MDTPITRAEHEEFMRRMEIDHKRLEEEDRRQNARIASVEEDVKELRNISVTIQRLATNMENMIKELEKQGKRLEALESRDGERWRQLIGYMISAVVGGIVMFALTHIGIA